MKILLTFALSVLLVGCNTSGSLEDDIVIPPELENVSETAVEVDLNLGQGVVLNNFTQRQLISSPLEISGVAPRRWFFEGIVPITLMDLEENIIAEGYGTGNWLEPLAGSAELGAEDPIAFTSIIEFTAPPVEVDMGKLRVAKDLVADESVPEYVETMILWE